MKVLHVITGLNTGGAEKMLVKLIQESSDDISHTVISLKDKGTQGYIIEGMGAQIFELNLKSISAIFKSFFLLVKFARKVEPNVIQGWMYHGNIFAFIAKIFFPNALCVFNIRHSLHDIRHEKKNTRFVIKLNRIMSYWLDSIIYNSRMGKLLHEDFGFNSKHSIVIPNGFEIDKFKVSHEKRNFFRDKFNLTDSDLLIGTVGRNHPVKDFETFVEVAYLLSLKYNYVKFIIIGRGVAKDSKLMNQINSLGLTDKFIIVDEITNVYEVLSAFDIYCNTSISEGFSNTIGEAMLMELPCVVTEVGDSKYIVGNTGATVVPSQPKLFECAISSLLDKSMSEREKLGMDARERVIKEFSIMSISNQYKKLYEELLEIRI